MPQQFFRVTNWNRFQHYKDRNPPWIKLYTALLDNYDFTRLVPTLKDLCREKRTRPDAIVQVCPQVAAYLTRSPQAESTPAVTPSFPTFGNLAKESYGVD